MSEISHTYMEISYNQTGMAFVQVLNIIIVAISIFLVIMLIRWIKKGK